MLATALEILGKLSARGRLAVIAGGAVRDLALHRPLTDVDIATDMPLDEIASLFRIHEVGRSKEFETVVLSQGGHVFEISRFRGGGAPARKGQTAAGFDQLREDTAHRDFTINALVMGADGRVIDLQGGLDDLRRRIVRAVGSPGERFAEDPVRVLRAVRFAACLGFAIESDTAEAMLRDAPLLRTVAGERIGREILKMASVSGAALAEAVELLARFGLLGMLLPEVGGLRGLSQPIEWHPEGDAWEHTLAALRSSASADPSVNLAVLLHDVGKRPAHREEQGRHCYRGHERAGGDLVDQICRRLFLPQRLRAAIVFAVAHHMQAGRLTDLRRSKRLALLERPQWPLLRALALCDIAARGDRAAVDRLESSFRRAEEDAAAIPDRHPGTPAISGVRIMALTGLAPGPRVGEIQRRVTEWALDNRVEDPERIAAEAVRLAAKPCQSP